MMKHLEGAMWTVVKALALLLLIILLWPVLFIFANDGVRP
jgi:hypothetical protein